MRNVNGEQKRHNAGKAGRLAVTGVLTACLACWGVVPAVSYADPTPGTEFSDEQSANDPAAGDTGSTTGTETQAPSADTTQETSTGESAKDASKEKTKSDSKVDTSASSSAKTSEAKTAKKTQKAEKTTKEEQLKKQAEQKAKVATAKQAIKEMNALAAKLETAYEDLAQQKAKLKKVKKQIKKNKTAIKNVAKDLKDAKAKVAEYACETYKNGSVRYLSVLLGATDFGDFVTRFQFMARITKNGEEAVQRVKDLQNSLSEQKQKLADSYAKKRELTEQAEQTATTMSDSLIEQTDYFAALPAKVRKAVMKNGKVSTDVNKALANIGSTSTDGSHPEVAKLALQYLGVNYVWGGETPSGFDCSGLVMYCYQKAAGISLTHYARTQYSEGKQIAKSALMPGDLVFFGPTVEGIHHVGIYLGNDKFIHAPHTGDVVKISSLSSRSDFIGACRP